MTNWLQRLIGETQVSLLSLLRRSRRTITGLAEELHLTDNAVRTHVAALGRDGMVEQVGTDRGTGGKPARVYALSREGEELFPKAYAFVLGALVEAIGKADGREHALELLRGVGERVASGVALPEDLASRVAVAAEMLRGLGGDIEVQRTGTGWRLQGYGCPLSAAAAEHPELCTLAQSLVAEVTGRAVTECCDRTERPRCAFHLDDEASAAAS